MNKVQLIYNPYQEKSRILINGNSVSEYSQLANYLQEGFEIWSPVILDCIEQELNDEFELEVISDEFHGWILKDMAESYVDCVSVSVKQFVLNISVLERFEKLEKFKVGRKEEPDVHILLFSKDRMQEAFILGELYKTGKYEMRQSALYLGNGKIECIVASDVSYLQKKTFALAICVEKTEDDMLETIGILRGQAVDMVRLAAVRMEEKLGFTGLKENGYYFFSDFSGFSKLVNELIEFLAVVPYIEREKENIEKKEQLDYLLIDAVEPLVMVYCDSEVEEGKTINLEITAFPKDIQLPEVAVKITNPTVLSYSNGCLNGLLDGETDIEVSVSGSVLPIYRNHIRVKRVIRITDLYIENASVTLKEGTGYEISYWYEPKDADNIDKIEWISTNENIARVISNGKIECLAEGICDIIIRAEKVSEKCRVCVKPEMKKIILPDKQIKLTMGQQISFMPEYEPKNCFDTRIFVEVDNPGIVSWDRGKLISKGLGNAQVTFANAEKTIKSTVDVVVESTLYATEKSNVYKIFSFLIAVISVFLTAVNGVYGVIGVILGVVTGGIAVMKDYENVEGVVNVRGEPMKPDCFGSILFIMINVLIGVVAIIR